MLPRLGDKYANAITIEITSKPKAEYTTDEYFALDLPVAPAVMVGDEIITEGKDIDDHTVEAAICRQLGLPEPPKAGFMDRLFKR
ncbi:MAG: hypothetical protein A2511_00050 [Deltaproteobacteria bacterium RIFOXYD12_FULL_50_9]|nr:MAG: hypothetical protein A2511_00050 [Deltaproteobacteria bacterium RIFOXYD12_FULL_50_9]